MGLQGPPQRATVLRFLDASASAQQREPSLDAMQVKRLDNKLELRQQLTNDMLEAVANFARQTQATNNARLLLLILGGMIKKSTVGVGASTESSFQTQV